MAYTYLLLRTESRKTILKKKKKHEINTCSQKHFGKYFPETLSQLQSDLETKVRVTCYHLNSGHEQHTRFLSVRPLSSFIPLYCYIIKELFVSWGEWESVILDCPDDRERVKEREIDGETERETGHEGKINVPEVIQLVQTFTLYLKRASCFPT